MKEKLYSVTYFMFPLASPPTSTLIYTPSGAELYWRQLMGTLLVMRPTRLPLMVHTRR